MAECESLGRLARPSGFVGAAAEQQDDKTMRQRDGGLSKTRLQKFGTIFREQTHRTGTEYTSERMEEQMVDVVCVYCTFLGLRGTGVTLGGAFQP
jgi:hypothetical protein